MSTNSKYMRVYIFYKDFLLKDLSPFTYLDYLVGTWVQTLCNFVVSFHSLYLLVHCVHFVQLIAIFWMVSMNLGFVWFLNFSSISFLGTFYLHYHVLAMVNHIHLKVVTIQSWQLHNHQKWFQAVNLYILALNWSSQNYGNQKSWPPTRYYCN